MLESLGLSPLDIKIKLNSVVISIDEYLKIIQYFTFVDTFQTSRPSRELIGI